MFWVKKQIHFDIKFYLCVMISKNKIKYIHSLEVKRHRKQEGVFVAEGPKLVGDLLPVMECNYIAALEEWVKRNENDIPHSCVVDLVTEEELRKVSFLETPQQVLAVFKQPVFEDNMELAAKRNLCIALDEVQNPGNLGTIVRLADWFGIEHIFCSKGCADIYNPKTVQATMGGIARVKVHYVELADELTRIVHNKQTKIYGTFLDGENIYDKELERNGIIIMGNEGKGVSSQVAATVNERLYIPNYPQGRETSESLNVAIATAIVCAEFRRRG